MVVPAPCANCIDLFLITKPIIYSYFLVSALQEANVTTNGERQSSVDAEAVINQLKEENSSLKER